MSEYGILGYQPSNFQIVETIINAKGTIKRNYRFFPIITNSLGRTAGVVRKISDYEYYITRLPDKDNYNYSNNYSMFYSDYTVSLCTLRDNIKHNTYGIFLDKFDIAQPSYHMKEYRYRLPFNFGETQQSSKLNTIKLPEILNAKCIFSIQTVDKKFTKNDKRNRYPELHIEERIRFVNGQWVGEAVPLYRDRWGGLSGHIDIIISTLEAPRQGVSDYGIQLFDTNGELIYDSNSEFHIEYLGEVSFPVASSNNQKFRFNYPGYIITGFTRLIPVQLIEGFAATNRQMRHVLWNTSTVKLYGSPKGFILDLNLRKKKILPLYSDGFIEFEKYGGSSTLKGMNPLFYQDIDRYILYGYKKPTV